MIDILFVIFDNEYRIKIINNLMLRYGNLRVGYILTSLEELNHIIENYKIDIVIVCAEELEYQKILYNKKLNSKRFEKSVIIINNASNVFSKIPKCFLRICL